MRPLGPVLSLVLLLLSCGDSGGPSDDLTGAWNLIGYSDAGTPAVTSGTAIFRANGTFSIDGVLTFPNEPPDPVSITGTWSIDGNIANLTSDGTTGRWVLVASGDEVVLTLEGSQPPTTMTLRRQ